MSATHKAWRHAIESRHARGYGTQWDRLREAVMVRDCGLCQPCRRSGRAKLATQVDHIVPKAKSGTDDMINLQAICSACHDDKTIADTGGRVKQTIGPDGWPMPR